MNVYSLIAHANKYDEGYSHIINGGDLQQMAAQTRFLQNRGLDIGHRDVYPATKTHEEYVRALRLLWEAKPYECGWWNLGYAFKKEGICAENEFATALSAL